MTNKVTVTAGEDIKPGKPVYIKDGKMYHSEYNITWQFEYQRTRSQKFADFVYPIGVKIARVVLGVIILVVLASYGAMHVIPVWQGFTETDQIITFATAIICDLVLFWLWVETTRTK